MTEKPLTNVKQNLYLFTTVKISGILHPSYKTLALCKLRWPLTDSGVSHYRLPDMPLLHYIRISESLDYPLSEYIFGESAYYCILSARNILVLLKKGYLFNTAVKAFFDMRICDLLEYADSLSIFLNVIVPESIRALIPIFKLTENSTFLELVDAVSEKIEPITSLHHKKRLLPFLLTRGSYRGVLDAYRLYRLVFSLLFIDLYPEKFSAKEMQRIYRNVRFIDDFDDAFTEELFDNA